MTPATPRLDPRTCALIFCALASVNLAFDVLHVAHVWAGNEPAGLQFLRAPAFSVEQDRGFSERWEYAVSSLIVLALVGSAARYRVGSYLAFAVAHGWLGLDNGFQVHEQVGAWVRSIGEQAPALVASPSGSEVSYFCVVALLGAAMLWAAWRATPAAHRPNFLLLSTGLLGIGLFAVGVDAFHTSGLWRPWKETLVILVEDGGESLALTANLALAAGIFLGAGGARRERGLGARA